MRRYLQSRSLYVRKKTVPFFSAGFSLIELLVTVSIFVIIASLALASYPQFSRRMALSRTAQEVALALRKTQSFSLGVRAIGSGPSIKFPSYGIHFSDEAREFFIFADLPGVGTQNQYDDGIDPKIEIFYIQSSPIISALCIGEETIPPGNCALGVLDIIYLRPQQSSGQFPVVIVGAGGASDAEIKVSNPSGTVVKTVVAWITGQIAVK